MQVIRFATAESYEPEPDWKRVCLCEETDISLEHFVKPPHHASPHHQHPSAQVLVVLEGELTISNDAGDEVSVTKGDAIYIPGNEAHVVANRLDQVTVGLDIFVPGRSFDFWRQRK